jgi:hypothetical protein
MTTTNGTPTAADGLQGTATWLRDGYKGLAILKRIEAGTIDPTIGSIPVVVRKHGDMLLSLCENGELWICPDGPVGQAFEHARIIPAADVDMFYRFLWSMAVAEVCDIATARETGESPRAGD